MSSLADTSGANQPKTGESTVGKNPESEPKFTPGPWIVDEVNTPNGKGYSVDHLWDGWDGETHTDEIADVVMDYTDPAIPLGNARLMAAAPDLYAACKAVTDQLCSHLDGNRLTDTEIARCADILLNAARKAEGLPPLEGRA